jgi:hypothetical protein
MGETEEGADRFEQGVPAAAEKRRKEAKQTKKLEQRRKKNVKECISSGGPQSDLVAHNVVVGYFLNIR